MRAERVIPLQDVERVRIYINEGRPFKVCLRKLKYLMRTLL